MKLQTENQITNSIKYLNFSIAVYEASSDEVFETCDMPEFTEEGVFHMDNDFTNQNSWLAV